MALVETGIRLTVAGEAAYRASIKSISQEMKALSTESKLAMAQLGNNARITDTYKTRQTAFGKELEASKKKTTALRDAQEKLSQTYKTLPNKVKSVGDAYRNYSKETSRLEKKYKDLKKSMGEMHPETQKVKQEWEDHKYVTSQLKDEYQQLSRELSATEKELAKLPDQINRSELASQRLTNQMQKEHEQWRQQGGRYADTAKKLRDFGTTAQTIGGKITDFGSAMTKRFTVPIATGFGLAAKQAGQFQTEIGRMGPLIAGGGKITASVRKEMDALGTSSRKWAIDYGKYTSDINASMTELIRNGYTSNQVMGMMPNVLNASIASGEELGTVMGTTANVLSQFQLKGKSTNETLKNTQSVVDALTYVANATSSGFYDLGEGLAYVGPVAKTLNMSVGETASILGILSDNGIQASQGGTALRGALTRLLKPSKQNAVAMKKLGINTEDYRKGLIDFPTILDKIATNTKNLTNEQKAALIAQAFGTESQSAMNALVNAGGDALREMTGEAKNAAGATKEIADAMKDLPEFKFEQNKAKLRDMGIELGNHVLPILMEVVDTATNWVSAFTKMDGSTQKFIVSAGLLLAAIGPVASTLGNIITTVGGVSKGISSMIQWFGKITTPKSLEKTADVLDDIPGKASSAGNAASLFSNPWVAGGTLAAGAIAAVGLAIWHEATEPMREHQDAVDATQGAYQNWFDSAMSGLQNLRNSNKETAESVREIQKALMDNNRQAQDMIDSQFQKWTWQGSIGEWINIDGKNYLNYMRHITNALKEMGVTSEAELSKAEEAYRKYGTATTSIMSKVSEACQSGIEINDDYANAVIQSVNDTTNAVVEGLEQQRQAQIEAAQSMKENLKWSDERLDQEIAQINSKYDKLSQQVRQSAENINSIMRDAAAKRRSLREEEVVSVMTSLGKMTKAMGQSASENEAVQRVLSENLQALTNTTALEFMKQKDIIDEATVKQITSAKTASEKIDILNKAIDDYVAKQAGEKNFDANVNGKEDLMEINDLIDQWDSLTLEEKIAQVEGRGGDELEQLVKALGVDWKSLSPDIKEAIANAEGTEQVDNLLFALGIWQNMTIDQKAAVLRTQVEGTPIAQLIEEQGLWNQSEFVSKFANIDTNAPEAMDKIIALVAEYSNIPESDIKDMIVKAESQGVEETKQKVQDVKEEVQEADGQSASVSVEANTETASSKLTGILMQWKGMSDQEAKTYIVEAQTETARNLLASTVSEWEKIDEDEAKQLIIQAQTELAKQQLDEVVAKGTALDGKNANMTVTAEATSAEATLTNAGQLADNLNNKNPLVTVSADGTQYMQVMTDTGTKLQEIDGKQANIFLNATDNASETAQQVKSEVDSVPDNKTTSLSTSIASAIGNALGALSLTAYKKQIESIPESKTTTITTTMSGVTEANSAIKIYNGLVEKMQNKTSTATTTTPGLPGNSDKLKTWNKTVSDMKSKTSTATTQAPGLPSNTNKLNAWNTSVNNATNKSSTLTTATPGLPGNTGKANAWVAALNSAYNKTSYLTTVYTKQYRTIGRHATGGHIGAFAEGGNLQWGGMFANGGAVPHGYMGIVGEAGPELFHVTKRGVSITPLSSSEKMRGVEGAIANYMKDKNGVGGGTNINVNVAVSDITIRDERDVELLAKQVGQQFKREVEMSALFRKGRTV
ncbi:phage tail tape measure protein [Facklamia hominis]|uniref:phage tail tape measure protein n=1 Tax=Facklamia hominis TaxID=178214 RepID=UPI00101D9E6C|nr:phage tail tape measure protein [Facklamia hominis]RYC97863.1 phage tail tape measure protein [Facklamia hominis]